MCIFYGIYCNCPLIVITIAQKDRAMMVSHDVLHLNNHTDRFVAYAVYRKMYLVYGIVRRIINLPSHLN